MLNFNKLSIREKQAIGAICILAFCRKHNIKYKGIIELSDHLLNLLVSNDLLAWNEAGLNINIIGRGEPFPYELQNLLSKEISNILYSLIDNVVEIGMIDLFGELTSSPEMFLKESLKILTKYGVVLDLPYHMFSEIEQLKWGDIWSIEKQRKLQEYIQEVYLD